MGKVSAYDEITIQNEKKQISQRNLYIKLYLKDGLGMEFTAC